MDFLLNILFQIDFYFRRFVRFLLRQRGPIVLYDDLSQEHFQKAPIWLDVHLQEFGRWLFELEDEESFRPWDGKYPAPRTFRGFVRAEFTAANGKILSGVIYHEENEPSDETWNYRFAPELFIDDNERIGFWLGRVESIDEELIDEVRKQFQASVGLTTEEAFPMTCEISDDILQPPISRIISGFDYFTGDDITDIQTLK